MRKNNFLLTLSILLSIAIVIIVVICWHHHARRLTTTLKVVLNGPYALVRTKANPNVITVVSPHDPEGIHRFYSNSLEEGNSQDVHITLSSDGLRPASSPQVNPGLADFMAETDLWVREKYFVTIELPVPEKVTFAAPLHQVKFENGTIGYMATNLVLEYRVTDSEKIHMTSPELNSVSPISSSALEAQYEKRCSGADIRRNSHYYASCIEMRNLLEQCAEVHTDVFFFGVGIPLETQMGLSEEIQSEHAVNFFNNVLLRSFPHLTSKRLAPKGAFEPAESSGPAAMLRKISFNPGEPQPHLRRVSAVIDCKAGNIQVGVPQ